MRRRTLAVLAGLAALAALTAAAPASSASSQVCYDVSVNLNGTPVAQQDCVDLAV